TLFQLEDTHSGTDEILHGLQSNQGVQFVEQVSYSGHGAARQGPQSFWDIVGTERFIKGQMPFVDPHGIALFERIGQIAHVPPIAKCLVAYGVQALYRFSEGVWHLCTELIPFLAEYLL